VQADLDDGRLKLGWRVACQGQLGVCEVAGSDRAELAGEPILAAQPRDGGLTIGGLVPERLEPPGRSAGTPAALQQDVEALLGERHPV
jgi:hypothetical protein